MTDRDILYRAILDSPEDDTLRLVYADALEEGGDPQRAAFVREQVQLSHVPEYEPAWVRARARGCARGPAFNPMWTLELELPDGADWARDPFRRGLPAAVQVRDGEAFVERADELFTRYPIEAIELSIVRLKNAREFAECSWLERLTALSLVQGASQQAIRPLMASEQFTRLQELHVGSELTTPATVAAVVRSKVFKQLTALGVRADRPQAGSLANELARLTKPTALKKLDLSGNRLNEETLAGLVVSPAVVAVEDLDLSDNNLGAGSVAALAGGALPAIRSLHLLRTRPQEDGVAALAGAAFFPELRSLSLGGNNLGPATATAIARAPADNLRVLDLRENRIGDRGARSLAESPHLVNLIQLDLAEAHLGDAGAEALADSPHLGGLLYLNLYGNPISTRAADRLRERFGDRVFLPEE
jgi:uncharacterized protein (TIGR02996 family)